MSQIWVPPLCPENWDVSLQDLALGWDGIGVGLGWDWGLPAPNPTLTRSRSCSNIAEALVSKGLATVLRYRQDDDQRSAHYDELLAAEAR